MPRRPPLVRPYLKDPTLSNAAFARRAWKRLPLMMDYLDPRSPLRSRRLLQKQIYEQAFSPYFAKLRRGVRVLDVGCGVGRFLLPLAQAGCRTVGVDLDHGHLRAVRRHGRTIRPFSAVLAQARADRLPFTDRSFDAALAIETLSYVTDPLKALHEIRRILRPKGLLLLSVETRLGGSLADSHLSLDQIESVLRTGHAHVPGSFFTRYFDETEIVRLLRLAGFRGLQIRPAHFILDGPLEPLVSDAKLRNPSYARTLLRLDRSLATLPPLRPLARAWAVVATTLPDARFSA